MQWSEVLDFVRQGSGLQLQFLKRFDTDEELGALIVAMANTQGGTIVVGMDVKNYHLLGTTVDADMLSQLIRSNIRPYLDVEASVIRRGDRSLCVLSVPEFSNKPGSFKGEFFIQSLESPFGVTKFIPDVIPDFGLIDNTVKIEAEPVVAELIDEPTVVHNLVQDEVILSPATSSDVSPEPKIWIAQAPEAAPTKITTLNKRQNKAMSHLGRHRSIGNKTYRQLFGVSHKTAHLELIDLVEKGVLQTQGAGRSTCYTLA